MTPKNTLDKFQDIDAGVRVGIFILVLAGIGNGIFYLLGFSEKPSPLLAYSWLGLLGGAFLCLWLVHSAEAVLEAFFEDHRYLLSNIHKELQEEIRDRARELQEELRDIRSEVRGIN